MRKLQGGTTQGNFKKLLKFCGCESGELQCGIAGLAGNHNRREPGSLKRRYMLWSRIRGV